MAGHIVVIVRVARRKLEGRYILLQQHGHGHSHQNLGGGVVHERQIRMTSESNGPLSNTALIN